jgi:hypothetical protein
MPTQISYDSCRIIPAPLVSFSKLYNKTGDGESIGSAFSITLTGKQLAYKGSPSSAGVWYTGGAYPDDESVGDTSRLAACMRKQEAIRRLFSSEGRSLQIQSADGTAPIKCNPRVVNIEFASDIWYNHFDYTITMECDLVYINNTALGEDSFPQYIDDASETWTFDTDEDNPESEYIPRTYRVSHSLSAKGKRVYDATGTLIKPAWQQARDYLLPKMGFDATIALSSGVNNLPAYYGAYNNVRNEQIDEQGGSYAITETFLLASGTATESFNVNTRTSIDGGLNSVSIEGTINGLLQRDSNFNITTTKYENANTKFTAIEPLLFTRAQLYSGYSLNSIATNKSVGRNPAAGTINYTYEFDNRPTTLFNGARSETMSVQDNWGEQSFATIFVLGRALGPVIQDLSTYQPRTRTFSIEAVMPTASGTVTNRLYTLKPTIDSTNAAILQSVVNEMHPSTFGATNVKVASQNSSWDGSRFSYQVSWTFQLSNGTII